MVSVVIGAVELLEAAVRDLEPGELSGRDAAALMEIYAKGERLCAAGKAMCAHRASQASVHLGEGHRSAASWMASRTGDSLGQAGAALSAAGAADRLAHLDEALRSGQLSTERASQVGVAASANRAVEAEMVALAKAASMKTLRERVARVQAGASGSAESESARYEAIRRHRYLRHWSESTGALRLEARLCPDDGSRVIAGIDAMAHRIFCDARRSGTHEADHAYRADALVELVSGSVPSAGAPVRAVGPSAEPASPVTTSTSSLPPAQVSVRVDAAALRRGFVQGDECCEIPGVGPVPVATARALLGDAWLRLLISEGVEVASICNVGRTVPAALRAALEERDPICVVPGCEVSLGLEIDHWQRNFADGGPTCASNLARLCHYHHLLKTHRGFSLEGGPGQWRWVPPAPAPSATGAPGAPRPPGPAPPSGTGPTAHPSLFDTAGP